MERRSTAAIRYAEAVFAIARDTNSFDTWLRELGEVEQLLADPLAEQTLLSPVVPRDRKANILRQALPDLNQPVQRFLELLLRRERLGLVPQIRSSLYGMIEAARGVETVKVTTAVPIGPAERDLLTARLSAYTGKQVRLDEAVDPTVVGGVVAQIGDEIVDGSVRGRLERLRRALAGT